MNCLTHFRAMLLHATILAGLVVCGVASADDQSEGATADIQTEEVQAGELTLLIPKSWESSPPSNNMRLAQFAIDPVEGDTEEAQLVIYPPFGGSVAANVRRWIDQFAKDNRQLKVIQGETEQGTYVLVDITGTYLRPIGPPIRQETRSTPGYRMLAVLFSKKESGNYSFKLTGPEKTVSTVTEQFRQSFGADANKEKPYEF